MSKTAALDDCRKCDCAQSEILKWFAYVVSICSRVWTAAGMGPGSGPLAVRRRVMYARRSVLLRMGTGCR